MTRAFAEGVSIGQRPMRADARRNYERILATAHEVFAENGTGASLEEIARRAGIGIGTLYRHFPTREDLLVAVMQNAFDTLHARATDLMEQDDAGAAIEQYMASWLRLGAVYKGVAAEVMNASLDTDRPLPSGCQCAQDDSRRLLSRAQEAGAIRRDVTHKQIWRLMNGLALGIKDADVSEQEARTMFDVIVKGLRF
jgi:AcrR family transcriptional regulator